MSFVTLAVDIAIGVLLIEALVLGWFAVRGSRAIAPARVAAMTGAGLGLLVALRAALGDAPPIVILLALAAGGLGHAFDLAQRVRN